MEKESSSRNSRIWMRTSYDTSLTHNKNNVYKQMTKRHIHRNKETKAAATRICTIWNRTRVCSSKRNSSNHLSMSHLNFLNQFVKYCTRKKIVRSKEPRPLDLYYAKVIIRNDLHVSTSFSFEFCEIAYENCRYICNRWYFNLTIQLLSIWSISSWAGRWLIFVCRKWFICNILP